MNKKLISMLLIIAVTLSLFTACGGASKDSGSAEVAESESTETAETAEPAEAERLSVTVAGLSGGMQTFPVYIALQNGWFDEENVDVEIIYFENGPVQMEALASGSWDVACTGIGGVLTGAIGYDAVVIGSPHSDDGTQTIFVRQDSDIVTAGQGNNTLNAEIYGDAASWKDKKVLCSAGTVLQYLLIKTLGGFGLTLDDVEFMAMDTPTTNSAFLQGEGDVAVLTGVPSFAEDKKDFVKVSSGPMANTGLICNVMATQEAMADKHDDVKAFMTAYFRAVEWIMENRDDAKGLLLEFCDESGKSTTPEVAEMFIHAEEYYTLEDNYNMMNTKAEGSEYSVMEQGLIDILNFFIASGNYSEGDDELFAGHCDPIFINEIYEEAK